MTGEKLVEHYGFKAAYLGKFNEWQNISHSLREQNPDLKRDDAAYKAYKMVIGSDYEKN